MSRPSNLVSKIFLDSGDPKDTKTALDIIGFLDGQTTNPSLVSKHPIISKCHDENISCSEDQILGYYKDLVLEIRKQIPEASVSVEVHADKNTSSDEMIEQGKVMNGWISGAHIKLPITNAGLEAASAFVAEGINVNMTLCFTQEQAAAVHAATAGAKSGQVYISPFIGRLEDIGMNGMHLIENITRMYKDTGSHVEVLAASIRNNEQFMRLISTEVDIVTVPLDILEKWGEAELVTPEEFDYNTDNFESITYQDLDCHSAWQDFDISHPLTDNGLERFADDWNALINQ